MKTRTITIKKKDVLFDIDAFTLAYANANIVDDAVRANAVSSETNTTAGTRTFTRLADRRAAEIRTVMDRYISHSTATTSNDMLSTSDYSFSLSIDDDFEDSLLNPLTTLMHDYIVKGAIADWFGEIGVRGQQEALENEAKLLVPQMKELIYYRPVPQFSC